MIQQIKLLLYITYHLALEKKGKRKQQNRNKTPHSQPQPDNQNIFQCFLLCESALLKYNLFQELQIYFKIVPACTIILAFLAKKIYLHSDGVLRWHLPLPPSVDETGL